jgi:hypothetical protein
VVAARCNAIRGSSVYRPTGQRLMISSYDMNSVGAPHASPNARPKETTVCFTERRHQLMRGHLESKSPSLSSDKK